MIDRFLQHLEHRDIIEANKMLPDVAKLDNWMEYIMMFQLLIKESIVVSDGKQIVKRPCTCSRNVRYAQDKNTIMEMSLKSKVSICSCGFQYFANDHLGRFIQVGGIVRVFTDERDKESTKLSFWIWSLNGLIEEAIISYKLALTQGKGGDDAEKQLNVKYVDLMTKMWQTEERLGFMDVDLPVQ